MTRTIAVAGAGMAGLVAALRLAQRGERVSVFERDAVPGGLAASFEPVAGGDPLERFYHHIFRSDTRMRALVAELGLEDRLYWSAPVTACLCDGEIARLDSAASLLRFKPLKPMQRVRLATAMALLKLSPSHRPYEHTLAQPWLRRIAGTAAHDRVFAPLFEAKFGRYAEEIVLSWFWARIHDRTAQLGYVRGGFAAVYSALAKRVSELGGEVRYGDAVTRIERVDGGLRVATAAGFEGAFDRAIAAMPVRALARLAPDLPAEFVEEYGERAGMAARCVILALDRSLTDAYWINVCERGAPFTVLVEHTNLRDPANYGGRHLVYLGNYGERFDALESDELLDRFEPWLRRVNPAFDRSWVQQTWQFVAPDAQPVVGVGYASRIAPHATPVEGLYVANLFQVYPHDRGQNYAVAMAESLAASLT